jgi:hypothetical protein
MKNIMMLTGAVALASIMSGCQMWKEFQERQAREEAARKAEMAEKGPVKYWLEKNASPEMMAKANNAKVNDPDLRTLLQFSVAEYKAAVASLVKVQVVQDGIAVWERAKVKHSENAKKEIKDFTVDDEKAAYAIVTDPKEKEALDAYLKWGKALEIQAAIAARQRNEKLIKTFVEYTAKAKKLAEKYKSDKMKMAAAIADGLNAISWLGMAGEASGIEADVMEAGRAAANHLGK